MFKRSRIPLIVQGIVGRSEVANSQSLINLIPQVDKSGKAIIALYNAPGLRRLRTNGPGPGRAGGAIVYDDVCYTLSGDRFYTMATNLTVSLKGTTLDDTGPVQMATNGLVVVLVDGTRGWSYTISSGAFAEITDAQFPANPIGVACLDGVFVVPDGDTQRFYSSTDGTSWASLDFASAETLPDDLLGVTISYPELILFGVTSTEIWFNQGGSGFTFSRRTAIEYGIASGASHANFDNSVGWLTDKLKVVRLTGYTAEIISDPDTEYRIKQHTAAEIAAAFAWTYADEGHWFYLLTIGDETFCYDAATKMWHERRYLVAETGLFTRHRAQWCVRFAGMNICADYENGRIHELDMETLTDDGQELSSMWTYRHIDSLGRRLSLNLVEIEFESGIGTQTGQGSDPIIEMRFSGDGGREWFDWRQEYIGKVGKYQNRAIFGRVGESHDCTIQCRITDPAKRVILNANAEASLGTL